MSASLPGASVPTLSRTVRRRAREWPLRSPTDVRLREGTTGCFWEGEVVANAVAGRRLPASRKGSVVMFVSTSGLRLGRSRGCVASLKLMHPWRICIMRFALRLSASVGRFPTPSLFPG